MANGEIHQGGRAARNFHEATKLSYINLRTKPPLYKSYPGLPQVPLPQASPPEMLALDAVSRAAPAGSAPLDLQSVAQLLHYSAGLIRKSMSDFRGRGPLPSRRLGRGALSHRTVSGLWRPAGTDRRRLPLRSCRQRPH